LASLGEEELEANLHEEQLDDELLLCNDKAED
jgi:hypothetical protein